MSFNWVCWWWKMVAHAAHSLHKCCKKNIELIYGTSAVTQTNKFRSFVTRCLLCSTLKGNFFSIRLEFRWEMRRTADYHYGIDLRFCCTATELKTNLQKTNTARVGKQQRQKYWQLAVILLLLHPALTQNGFASGKKKSKARGTRGVHFYSSRNK